MMSSMTSRLFVLLLSCVVSMLGCYTKDASSNAVYTEAPADYGPSGSYGTGGDGGDHDYYADSMPMEAPEPSAPPPPRRALAGNKQKAEKERGGKLDEFTSAADTEDSKPADGQFEPEPAPLEVTADTPKQPAPVAQKRQIIYTATMQVSVFDLEHSLEIVEGLPDRYGGWMQQRIDNQIVLRIPAERLQEAMATVAELGVVDYRLLESLDVTAEYTDLESRIQILSEMQKHLKALLAKATSVEQALEIRRALDQITLELEAARAQMREMSKSIAFSTLILSLVERGPTQLVPSSNDPFPWVDELGVEATDYR
jgi:chemotaxis protein histidine kinase CheA